MKYRNVRTFFCPDCGEEIETDADHGEEVQCEECGAWWEVDNDYDLIGEDYVDRSGLRRKA